MNVNCTAEPCPVILDAACVFYSGGNLPYTGIVNNDNLQTALQKIDAKFQDASIGYVFQNGITQSTPGAPVKLGGALNQNTTITSSGYTLTVTENIIAAKHITTGGTASQFVKGDGSLDGTSYQPTGNYITALAGDGTANGPGLSIFTLNNVNTFPGTYGNATQVPIVTVNAKGLVTNVSTIPINFPVGTLIFTGDVTGTGTTGTNTVLTLLNVNSNVYPANTFLKFAVNAKGLVTSAAPVTNLDVEGALGYVPVPETRTITINGVTKDLSNNRSWTFPAAIWGSISGTITSQTDLITYLSTNYTPQSRTLTINGVTYDLSANRSWTVSTLPSQTGNAGKFLTTDGTTASWSLLPPSGVSAVTATAPLSSSGGSTPDISISQSTSLTDGYLSSTDWNIFNGKATIYYQTTAPLSPSLNDMWMSDVTGILYQYVDDGTSTQWVQQTLPLGPVGPTGPAGPNNITSSTVTNLVGILKGDGLTVSVATAGVDYQTVTNLSIDGTFAANSDTLYPSQKATKTYVDNITDDIDYTLIQSFKSFYNY